MAQLPHDPDLQPVAAAAAFLAASPLNTPKAPMEPRRPLIEPANPADWKQEIILRFPLKVDGALLDRLTLRLMTGDQLIDLITQDDSETSLKMRAYAVVAGVHPDVLDALAGDDKVEVLAAIRPFLPQIVLDEASPGDGAALDGETAATD